MGRIYTVSYNGTITSAGADTDYLEVNPADDRPVLLRGMLLSQISEVADAAEEALRITIRHFAATVTSGNGTAVTPRAMDQDDSAADFTAECNGATVATTSGNNLVLAEIGWNNRNSPYELWFPDRQFCPKARQGEAIIVRQETTLADDMTACLTFWLEEE